jgi:hypothetical protein
MPSFPNRCQHIKVNGTQCACPALRRNRFCYFHKRHQEQRIALNTDRLRNDRARCARNLTFDLPVIEDANSIQVALMQVIHLLLAGRLDPKIAGLTLYALQTASANLRRTNFEPFVHNVVLDPKTVGNTPLERHVWEDSDFEEEEYEDEDDEEAHAEEEARREAKRQAESRARNDAEAERLMAEGRIEYAKELELERRADARLEAERRRRLGLDEFPEPPTKPPATPTPTAAKTVSPPAAATTQTTATAQAATTTKPPTPAAAAAALATKTATAAAIIPAPTADTTTATTPPKTSTPAPALPRQAVVTPSGSAVLQPPSPHSRRTPIPSVEEVRKSIKKQVQQALPEILHALNQKSSPRTG